MEMNKVIEAIYGHKGQVQPSHIVITSPLFDTREIKQSTGLIGGRRKLDRAGQRERVAKMRELRAEKNTWEEVGAVFGISGNAAETYWHANKKLLDTV